MITIQQINQFREKAKAMGKSDLEINNFINQKLQGQEQTPFSPKLQTDSNLFTPIQQSANQNSITSPQIVKDVGKGFFKGVGSTLSNLETLGQKALDTIAKPVVEGITGKSYDTVPTAHDVLGEKLKPTNTAQKLGFYGEQIGEFFIPSSLVTKGTKVLEATKLAEGLSKSGRLAQIARTGLTRSIPEAIGAAATSTAQNGNVGKDSLIAGLIPLAGKGLSTLLPSSFTVKSVLTGVGKQTFQRIKSSPEAYDLALEMVNKNPDKPFLSLASTIGNRMKKGMETAKTAYSEGVAKIEEKFGSRGYNVSKKLGELAAPLKEFNLGVTLSKNGRFAEVFAKPQSPINKKQLEILSDLVNTVNQSKNITLRDVIDLGQKFQSAYDLVPLGVNGNPTKYHALVKSLESKFDEIAGDTIPQLKTLNRQYSVAKKVYDRFQSKFLKADGEISEGAEQYLSNLLNGNKGEQQKAIRYLEEFTGVNILDNVVLLKDAQKLNQLFPATGSRTQDIVRALVAKGAASLGTVASASTLNVPGMLASGGIVAATSPKVVGKASIAAAKLSNKISRKTPGFVKALGKRIAGS